MREIHYFAIRRILSAQVRKRRGSHLSVQPGKTTLVLLLGGSLTKSSGECLTYSPKSREASCTGTASQKAVARLPQILPSRLSADQLRSHPRDHVFISSAAQIELAHLSTQGILHRRGTTTRAVGRWRLLRCAKIMSIIPSGTRHRLRDLNRIHVVVRGLRLCSATPQKKDN